MNRFVAYTRVSTGEQTSTDAQLAALYPLATSRGGTILSVETDVLSGHEDQRRGYQRVLEMARRREIDGVLVWKLDRLGRNHVEGIRAAHELETFGVHVHSATEPTDDPFVRDLLLLLANRESRVLAERVRLKQRANVQAGYWQWPAPPGYRIVHQTPEDARNRRPKLEPNADAPLIRRLFELGATGDYSLRGLRDEAQAMGLTSTRGHILSRTHVHGMLKNPVYVGDIAYGRRQHGKFSGDPRLRPEHDWLVVHDAHEAIVDRETFQSVQNALARHKRFQGDVRGTTYLLTGIVYCGHCGSRMYGAKGGRGNFVYACSRGQAYGDCELKSVGGKGIDAYVKSQLSQLVITPEVRARAELLVVEREASRQSEASSQRQNLLRDRERHQQARLDLLSKVLGHDGLISPDVYQRFEAREVDAIAVIDRALATLDAPEPIDVSAEIGFLKDVSWSQFDDEAWRQAATLLLRRVTVERGDKKGQPRLRVEWTSASEVLVSAASARGTRDRGQRRITTAQYQ
ncbi:MAG TPA: recombinase family protein [Dehalococcoidia bacterium]|nr:recombinase family protein [Dehalococcoidia bacterium]